MAVTFLSDTDLRLMAAMPPAKLRKILSTMSLREALIFRRNLQVSLASYSKKHPARGSLDLIQGQVIGICKQIENAARDAYTVAFWRKIKAAHPNMTQTEKFGRKYKIKTDWEKLLKTYSY